MTDISKCTGEGCVLKDHCYRFTAPAGEFMQSYLGTPPINKETGKCELFWPVRGWEANEEKNEEQE